MQTQLYLQASRLQALTQVCQPAGRSYTWPGVSHPSCMSLVMVPCQVLQQQHLVWLRHLSGVTGLPPSSRSSTNRGPCRLSTVEPCQQPQTDRTCLRPGLIASSALDPIRARQIDVWTSAGLMTRDVPDWAVATSRYLGIGVVQPYRIQHLLLYQYMVKITL